MKQTKWFERKFAAIEDNGLLPNIIERLEGTPVRLAYKVSQLEPAKIIAYEDHWSIKKEIGHLIDLEPLWLKRAYQIVQGVPALKAADLTNRKTEEANHDGRNINDLVAEFTEHRKLLTEFLHQLNDSDLDKSSTHPRLGTPMKIIDLAYFVAEHDDHHLTKINGY